MAECTCPILQMLLQRIFHKLQAIQRTRRTLLWIWCKIFCTRRSPLYTFHVNHLINQPHCSDYLPWTQKGTHQHKTTDLPILNKFITSTIAGRISGHLRLITFEKQTGYRFGTRGCKEQLITESIVVRDETAGKRVLADPDKSISYECMVLNGAEPLHEWCYS